MANRNGAAALIGLALFVGLLFVLAGGALDTAGIPQHLWP